MGAQSELLRGGVAWIYKHGDVSGSGAYAHDPGYYATLSNAGLNAVRLVCFDPWQRSHGYPFYDFNNPRDLEQFLLSLDQAVNAAECAGLYALINYHDVGRCDRDFSLAFWRAVAPRYANRTHVFYELVNEPVKWFPEDYSEETLSIQRELYQTVRELAPATHIVLFTFANLVGNVPDCTPESVISRLEGVDWTNASAGFHPYRTHGSSEALIALRRHYPVINTEQNLAKSHGGPDYLQPMDGHEWGSQTMETLGVSWFAWEVEGTEKFRDNFINGFLADAQRKQYAWQHSHSLPVAGVFRSLRAQASALPFREWNRVMGLRWLHVAGLTGLHLAATILDVCMLALLLPMLQGAVTGTFGWMEGPLAGSGTRGLLLLALSAFLVSVGKNAALYAANMYNAKLYAVFSSRLAAHAFERFLSFGKSYFDSRETGRLNSSIDRHHDVLNLYQPMLHAISTTLLLAGHFSIMLWISWRMTLMALLIFPAMTLASRWAVSQSSAAAGAIRRDESELGRGVWMVLGALPLFRSFAREPRAAAEFRALSAKRGENGYRMWRANALSTRLLDIAVQASVLAMLTFGFAVESHGPGEVTRLLVFFFVARVAVPEVAKYHDMVASFTERLPGAREFATLFDDQDKHLISEGSRELAGLEREIEFRSLVFRYPNGPAALTGVSFRMEKGTMTAVVGPTGAGKSTLTHLLVRFYDVTPGSILIDGTDIREFTFESVRRNISIVSQDVILLNESLRDNLTFGASGEVSEAALREAASGAQLDDVISTLPQGLDTSLGEHGSRLSGGQRQRVAIARALIKRAPILVLDEATSALDSLTEARLQQAIAHATGGCTSLVIAHRLSTIRKADRIIVLDGGRIAEQGTLAELLANRGLFHRMWEQQNFQ